MIDPKPGTHLLLILFLTMFSGKLLGKRASDAAAKAYKTAAAGIISFAAASSCRRPAFAVYVSKPKAAVPSRRRHVTR